MRKGSSRNDLVHGFGVNDIIGDSNLEHPDNKCYQLWVGILRRCYSKNRSTKNMSYVNTTVCNNWKYYSNFKKWYYTYHKDGYQLDKDIIGGTLNIYSPETCSFIPNLINSCIIDGNRKTTITPVGVSQLISRGVLYNKYISKITKYCKQIHLGVFNTPEEAHCVWQISKRNYLLELMDKYKNDVVPEVIQGLQKRVDILNDDINNGRETKTISKV